MTSPARRHFVLRVIAGACLIPLGARAEERDDFLKAHDRNGDGKLSREEWTVPPERFAKADANGDGTLDGAEIDALVKAKKPAPKERERAGAGLNVKSVNEAFEKFDKNGDGKLSADELGERAERLMKFLDANQDGTVDRHEAGKMEFGPAARGPGGYDADHDGKVSAAELAKALFRDLDLSRDHYLSIDELDPNDPLVRAAEITDAAAFLKEQDKDGDRFLSEEEFRAPAGLVEKLDKDGTGGITTAELAPLTEAARKRPSPMVREIDTDGDGKISKAEAPVKLQERWDEADVNKDGFIDGDEMKQVGGRILAGKGGTATSAPVTAAAPEMKPEMKSDDDAKMDKENAEKSGGRGDSAAAPQLKPGGCCDKAKQEGRDCNHPCCKDAAAAGKVCSKCNPGTDTASAPKEAKKTEPPPAAEGGFLKRMVEKMDADKDGNITRAEWKGREQGFTRLDKNGDGKISADEIQSATPPK